jgi:hypothetical protein
MKVHCELKEHESIFLQATDTFRKHKMHSTFEGLSYSVQHEGMLAVCDDSLTVCAVALKWTKATGSHALRSRLATAVTKRRNNGTKMDDHERSESRTSRLHCTKTRHVCMVIAHNKFDVPLFSADSFAS